MQPTLRHPTSRRGAHPGRRPADAPAAAPPRRAGAAAAGVLALALAACSPAGGTEPTGPTASTGSLEVTAEPTGSPEPDPAEVVPTPDEHSAVGELADGFPATLLPLPQDADVLVSTWAPEAGEGAGQPYAVSLNLTTALPAADVAALYRTSLTAAGFTETVGAPDGLAAESTYNRSSGAELLTVGVLDRDGVRTVTVGGRVHADG